MFNRRVVVSLCSLTLCLFLSACAGPTAQPTETPIPTEVALPSETPQPEPSATSAEATATLDMFDALDPTGKPAAEWQGFPIMPGAIAGGESNGTYYFTIQATSDDIKTYYDKEMPKLGYSSMAVGNSDSRAVVLFYQGKDGSILSLSLFTKEDVMLVMMSH
jgi:hypothetical protein